jgi:dihydroorotase
MALVEALASGLIDAVMSDHDPQDVETKRLPFAEAAPGSPADVVVFDPDTPWVLDRAELKSKCKNTPFDEARLQGRVTRTIVAGRTVYEYV